MALGGVMGGVDSEVADSTTDLLIESAEFDPMSIRTTARKLNLHSPSSYRFERTVDPKGVDWASRRCCQLILELAGGQLAEGVLDVGSSPTTREPVVLRLDQLLRILGIDVDGKEVHRILTALGTRLVRADSSSIEVIPPSWRRDLTREIDLVEEVARIHGYDKIPEDVQVPMAPSHRLETDHVQHRVRQLLTTAGYDEAITASVVPLSWAKAFSPWNHNTPLQTSTPMLKGADTLRKSLVPSILEARRANESVANPVIELFEMANVYLPDEGALPHEQWTLGITSGGDFHGIKGVVEGLLQMVFATRPLAIRPSQISLLDTNRQCELMLGDRVLGYLGDVSAKGLKQFGLRRPTSIAELSLDVLAAAADLIRQHRPLSDYPAISRDLNLVVDEPLRWLDLETTVRQAAGPLLESLQFQEVYRDRKKDGPGKKRLFFSISLRSAERTLTNEEADHVRQTVVDACARQHQAVLLG